MEESLQTSRTAQSRPTVASQLTVFAVKALIVAAIITISVVVIANQIGAMIDEGVVRIQMATKIGGTDFWKHVERELDRAADPQMVFRLNRRKDSSLTFERSLSSGNLSSRKPIQ
jgi:hypothetical protein